MKRNRTIRAIGWLIVAGAAVGAMGFSLAVPLLAQTTVVPDFEFIPATDMELGGPAYDFRISRFEISNAQFVEFLNDAKSNPDDPRGEYLYFDLISGDVYINTVQVGQAANGDGGRTVLIFSTSPSPADQIQFDNTDGTYSVKNFLFNGISIDFNDHPVTGVTWYGALKYCNWLTVASGLAPDQRLYVEATSAELDAWRPVTITSADWATRDLNDEERELLLEKLGYRLPMDGGSAGAGLYNEWHKVASARFNGVAVTFDALYSFGRDTILPTDANYIQSNDSFELNQPATSPVGYYDGINLLNNEGAVTTDTENFYGLYDLSGNVWEWMQDQTTTDPSRRRARGGSWQSTTSSLLVTSVASQAAITSDEATGFRIVQSVVHPVLVTPAEDMSASGVWGGPYLAPEAIRRTYTLTNLTNDAITITVTADDTWVSISPNSGTINPNEKLDVVVEIAPACESGLVVGNNATTLHFLETNIPTPEFDTRDVQLAVTEPIIVAPAANFISTMSFGSAQASPANKIYSLQNASLESVSWSAVWMETTSKPSGVDWLRVDFSGSVLRESKTTVDVKIDLTAAATLALGTYTADVTITDDCTGREFLRQVTLSIVEPFSVTPLEDSVSSGITGGPFDPVSFAFTMTNLRSTPINWSVQFCTEAPGSAACTAPTNPFWLELDKLDGVLTTDLDEIITASLTPQAGMLEADVYEVTLRFTQPSAGFTVDRKVSLDVTGLRVEPLADLESLGPLGGPFTPASFVYTVFNTGLPEMSWLATITFDPPLIDLGGLNWLEIVPTSGVILDLEGQEDATVSITADAQLLGSGRYDATIEFSAGDAMATRQVTLIVGTESFAVPMISIPGDDLQLGGPTHDFRIGRFEITNEEYVRFLNATLRNAEGSAPGITSENMFFDLDSGDVYVADSLARRSGNEAPSATLTTLIFNSSASAAVSYNGFKYLIEEGQKTFPVSGVSWFGALKFCNWLTLTQGMDPSQRAYTEGLAADLDEWRPASISLTDWRVRDLNDAEREALLAFKGFRLPMDQAFDTEGLYNEWYKAASARRVDTDVLFDTLYGFGRDVLQNVDANFRTSGDPHEPGATPVGFFDGINTLSAGDLTRDTANGYNLYDLSGNVAEWVQDRDVDLAVRGSRGGHFNSLSDSTFLRTTQRSTAPAGTTTDFIGFRILQVISPIELVTFQNQTRIEGYAGGPFEASGFTLSVINNSEQSVDTLSVSVSADWLAVDGVIPTLIAPGATIIIPLKLVTTPAEPGVSPSPSGDMAFIPAHDIQVGGVDYDYWIGHTEVTNAQFVIFLNDARDDALSLNPDQRSEYLYFDSDSGSVYLNDKRLGEEGPFAPDATRTTLIYDATIGRISRSGTPYVVELGFGTHPVVGVSWYGALKYCNWLSLSQEIPVGLRAYEEADGLMLNLWHPVTVDDATWLAGMMPAAARRTLIEDTFGYRLPMDHEAGGAAEFNEWFKAASRIELDDLGQPAFDSIFGFGREVLEAVDANYFDSGDTSSDGTTPSRFFNNVNRLFKETTSCFPPVATSPLTRDTNNGYNLFDATGNVAEWTQDQINGDVGLRATRGGSWRDNMDALSLTTTQRSPLPPSTVNDHTGFRVVASAGHVATVTVSDSLSGESQKNHFVLHLREPFELTPRTNVTNQSVYGQPIDEVGATYTLNNRSDSQMEWELSSESNYLEVLETGSDLSTGMLEANATLSIEVMTNAQANALPPGTHTATAIVRNLTTGTTLSRTLELIIDQPISIETLNDEPLMFSGSWGSSFDKLPIQTATLTNQIDQPFDYQITTTVSWLMIEPVDLPIILTGTLAGLQAIPFNVSLTDQANLLAPGTYETKIRVTLKDIANANLTWTLDEEVTLIVHESITIDPPDDLWLLGTNPDPDPDPNITPHQIYTITNFSDLPIVVAIEADADWLTISNPQLEIFPGAGQARQVTVSLNDNVLMLFDGDYPVSITFENTLSGLIQCRSVELTIEETISVSPFSDFVASGAIGVGANPPPKVYLVTNVPRDASGPLDWQANVLTPGADWIKLNGATSAGGTLADGESASVFVTLDMAGLAPGEHVADIGFTQSLTVETVVRQVRLSLVQPAFTVDEQLISGDEVQPLGPEYDFFMNTYHTTNAEFVAFLNDALSNLNNERGQYLFFDSITGEVFVNTSQTGMIGPDPGARMIRMFDPAYAGQIVFSAGQYQVATTTSDFSNHPVTGVSWYGALKYANWLTLDQGKTPSDRCYAESTNFNNLLGWHPVTITTDDWEMRNLTDLERESLVNSCRGYRLPMDHGFDNFPLSNDSADRYNEWYKASAWNETLRRSTRYGFGRDSLTGADANFFTSGDPFDDQSTPVGYFDGTMKTSGFVTNLSENGFGLFDMSGNVYQWLQGRYTPMSTSSLLRRTIRGGGWNADINSDDLRNDFRNFASAHLTGFPIGLRVMRTPAQAQADINEDGVIDAADALVMSACLSGPAQAANSACITFDLAMDNLIDLKDFAAFQLAYTGSAEALPE